jgi:hypothetical protein
MSDTPYITDDSRDDPQESEGDSDNSREDLQETDDEKRDLEWLDRYFDKIEEERGDNDSDSYACECWDEPNFNSADHGYYLDFSS